MMEQTTKNEFSAIFKNWKLWAFLLGAAAFVWVAFYFFADIIIYILIAFMISMIGKPIVHFLEHRLKIPKSWGSLITLVLFVVIFLFLCWIIIPLIAEQFEALINLDYTQIAASLQIVLSDVQQKLWDYKLLDSNQTLENLLIQNVLNVFKNIHYSSLFNNVIGTASSFFIGLFSVVFVSFFFLKDQKLFYKIILLFVPRTYEEKADNIITNSRKLLTRYFVGLSAEIFSMITLLSLGMWILGVKNALFLGMLGGFFNIIPYLGPLIGATLASLIAYIGMLSGGYSPDAIWVIVKVVAVFSASNLIDNFVLQPIIYSNSVKAHPLEIFVVIMMAGTIGGVVGMILAIPVYTLLRIIAKEFFRNSKFVNKLTENI